MGVEVILIGVARQLGKPRRVRLGNRASEGVLVDISHLEVVEETSEYSGVSGHGSLRCGRGFHRAVSHRSGLVRVLGGAI